MDDESRHAPDQRSHPIADQDTLLNAIERLMAINAVSLKSALDEAAHHIAELLAADKVDAFIFEESSQSLVALGTSDTPMGHQQVRLGLDRLPVANGGRYVHNYRTSGTFITGRSDLDEMELPGIVDGLGVRSTLLVPLIVDTECRGLLGVMSAHPDYFREEHLRFITAVSHWLGIVAHRAELMEQLTEDAVERGRQIAAKELITILAHDLRNYLTPLKLRVAMMLRKANREQRADDARDISEAAATIDRLNTMIGELLDASRLEDGVFSLTRVPFDIVELARGIVASFQIHDKAFEVDAPEELLVVGDPDRIQQALENLLSNAAKYAPAGTSVRLKIEDECKGGQQVTISVSDKGPGIAPEVLPRLFQRFAAGSDSGGLGLGLYVASRIAAAHGGTLTADSAPGKGATFRLSIPIGHETSPG